ncbi:MAG: hypothetical protein ACRDMJ_02665 [Solirubrobacteraceae bacterium]
MAESKRFLLRLDPRLFEAIRRWADDDLRSINAQIEYLLTERARRAGRLPHRRSRPPEPEVAEQGDDDGEPPATRDSTIGAGASRR